MHFKKRLFRLLVILVRGFYRRVYRVQVVGLDKLPRTGRIILAANHTSLHDPIIMSAFLDPGIRFLAKEELFHIPILGNMIRRFGAYPVPRAGCCLGAIRHSLHLLNHREIVGIFPEGTRNRHRLKLPAKPGVGFIATRIKDVTLVPIAITLQPYQLFRRHYVIVGDPILLKDSEQINYRVLAQHVMDVIYSLKDRVEAETIPVNTDPIIE